MALLTQAEFGDDRAVTLDIVHLQVIKQLLALTYQGHQGFCCAVVLFIGFQMPCEVIDACCEQRDLAFRNTGILVGTPVLLEYFPLGFGSWIHLIFGNGRQR